MHFLKSYIKTGLLIFTISCCLSLSTSVKKVMAQETFRAYTVPANFGARASSMANANSADAYDIASMYSNPALTAFNRNPSAIELSALYQNKQNMKMGQLLAPLFNNRKQSFNAGFLFHLIGSDYLGLDQNTFKKAPSYYRFDLNYARALSSTFSIGATSGAAYSISDSTQTWSNSSAIGIYYSPTPTVSYGAVFKGGFSGSYYIYDSETTSLQKNDLPKSFEIGVRLRYPTIARSPFLTLSFANEKVIGQHGLWYKGGIELLPINFLAIRSGYIYGPELQGARFGIGFNLGNFRLDYAISTSAPLFSNQLHQLTFSIKLR